MTIGKQKIAFLITCLCAGSAFSAGFPMPHAPRDKSCPIYVEKAGITAVAQPEANQGQTAVVDRKAGGKSLVLDTQTSASGGGGGAGKTQVLDTLAHSSGGGGGAGKTSVPTLPGQKSAPGAQ